MGPARVLVILLFLLCLGTAQETTTYIGHYLEPFPGPQVYKDPNSGTLFYVETDGRHLAAVSDKGKLLWTKDPFKDAHLPFYRTEKPQIVFIGPAPRGVHPGLQEFLPLGFWISTIQGSEAVRFLHLSPDGILFRRPSTQSGKDWQCQTTVEQATASGGSGKDLYHETLRPGLVCHPCL
jgi:hypothetical protein